MRDQSDLFVYFMKQAKLKLNNSIDELHEAYIRRNTYYGIIKAYKDSIEKSTISYKGLEGIYNNTSNSNVYIPRSIKILDNEEENDRLLELLRYYNYLYHTIIPKLVKDIHTYSFLASVPYYEFVKIVREFNRGASQRILLGEKFIMPSNIGGFKIEFMKRPPEVKAINWKESTIYKRYLLANNRQPANYENPDGEEWLIYFTDDYYLRWTWMKKYCKTANGHMYSFSTTSYQGTGDMNIDEVEETLTTKEEILEHKGLGNLQKALMLSRKFNDIKELYFHGI